MEIKEFLTKKRTEFNNVISLTGVIPLLVFFYLLVGKISSLGILVGEIGYIMLATIGVFLTGMIVGRKMLLSLMQELIEKNRLAAITETTLSLSHEINNPLLTIRGNVELLETDFCENNVSGNIKNRLSTIKSHCERIRQVTDKMASLSKPVSEEIFGDSRMISLAKSQ